MLYEFLRTLYQASYPDMLTCTLKAIDKLSDKKLKIPKDKKKSKTNKSSTKIDTIYQNRDELINNIITELTAYLRLMMMDNADKDYLSQLTNELKETAQKQPDPIEYLLSFFKKIKNNEPGLVERKIIDINQQIENKKQELENLKTKLNKKNKNKTSEETGEDSNQSTNQDRPENHPDYIKIQKELTQLHLISKAFDAKIKEQQAQIDHYIEPIRSSLFLNTIITNHKLPDIILACNCMPEVFREVVSHHLYGFAQNNLQSNTITILSIGPARLKQELMTAARLMKLGYHVNFILIEPTYYIGNSNFTKLNYAEIKTGFEAIASDLSREYQRECKIVATFPSLYFYFKTLFKTLDFEIDPETIPTLQKLASILREEDSILFSEFNPSIYSFSTLYLPGIKNDENSKNLEILKQNSLIQEWHQNKAGTNCLLIRTETQCFIATSFFINDEKQLLIYPCKDDIIVKTAQKIVTDTCIKKYDLGNPIAFNAFNNLLFRASRQTMEATIELLTESIPPDTAYQASDLLPNVFMAIDTENKFMSNFLENIILFFKSLSQKGLFLEPAFLHYERGKEKYQKENYNVHSETESFFVPRALIFSELAKFFPKDTTTNPMPEKILKRISKYAAPREQTALPVQLHAAPHPNAPSGSLSHGRS